MLKLTVKIAAKIVEAINHFDDRNFRNNGGFEPTTSYFLSLILRTGRGFLSIVYGRLFFRDGEKKLSYNAEAPEFLSLSLSASKNIPIDWLKREAWRKFEEFSGRRGEKGNKKE